MTTVPALTREEARQIDAWWRANNYLTVGQIYLKSNPLPERPLTADDIKPRLLGHWGTSPGLSFIYAHLNRLIKHTDQDFIYITGPGHGGPAVVSAPTWRAPTPSASPASPLTPMAWPSSSASSPHRVASPPTHR